MTHDRKVDPRDIVVTITTRDGEERTIQLRRPSPIRVSKILSAADEKDKVAALSILSVNGVTDDNIDVSSTLALLMQGGGALSLIGCLIGIAVNDPNLKFDVDIPQKFDADNLMEFGECVIDTLDEFVQFDVFIKLGSALLMEFLDKSQIIQKVEDRKNFFSQRTEAGS